MGRHGIAYGLVLALLCVGACGDDDDGGGRAGSGGRDGGAGSGSGGSGGRSGTGGSADAGGTGGTSGSGGSVADAGAALSDAEIAQIALTLNSGEVAQGMVAVAKAQRAEVRSFAQMLATMHMAAAEREMDLFEMIQLTPEESALSMELQADSDAAVQQLNAAAASAFDELYVRTQVEVHTMALDLIDDRLLPDVRNGRLRGELMTMRTAVSSHLQLAKDLLETLQQDVDAGTEDAGA